MSLSTLAIAGTPMLGRQLTPSDRIQIVNTATGEARWSGQITHFAAPHFPARKRNRLAFPRNTRIAWAGTTCLGPVPDDALVLVDRQGGAA